ncbi:MAG TPA: Hsp20/alpha crystallin family protein [Candidatus Acidoferrales bacterium]|nr:Hsp20/alpha crystallin family protein [Candidatus Acidoferrales bacterium]
MTNLVSRNNFFQDLFDFRRDFDQMFNRMLTGGPDAETQMAGQPRAFAPAVESYIDKDGKTFHCRISVPGIDPKDVQIHAQGNSLTISGERKFSRSSKDVDFIHNEIWYGSFERTLPLPEGVDPSKVNAEYRDGLLEITAPISASALPRRIEIKTSPLTKQMTA